jgi:hypothetical protein
MHHPRVKDVILGEQLTHRRVTQPFTLFLINSLHHLHLRVGP